MTTISTELLNERITLKYRVKLTYYIIGEPDTKCTMYLSANSLEKLEKKISVYLNNIHIINKVYTNHTYSAPKLKVIS